MIALLVPFAVITLLRINAAMAFLSLCLGYVLVELVAKDANSLVTFLAPQANSVSQTSFQLAMLLGPLAITCIITLFSINGRLKELLNILPAAAVSVLALLLAVPLLTPGLRYALQADTLWVQVNAAQSGIVGIGALISMISLWGQRRAAKKTE